MTAQLSVANIYVAAANGYLNLIQQYVNDGGEINQAQNVRITFARSQVICFFTLWKDGSTLLTVACQNGHLKVVSWLLDRAADFHHKDNVGINFLQSQQRQRFTSPRLGTPHWL
jgi:ankyrin repeat protein